MKTIAVLAALAAVATAVPALPGYGYDRYKPYQQRLLSTVNREKKSPQLETLDIAPAAVIEDVAIPIDIETSARTIGHKKPIIVKKKFGYHLYRDSDEEQAQADPQEKCTKQVKVKLCDAENLSTKPSAQMRSAAEETSAEISENDMKNSIMMAKEAVENLQKLSQFKNADMGPDAELHGDIEVARQALEHIQKNFGNLEEMNVQAATLSEAEALQKARFTIAKTDVGRMAQWKEAIDNIQKNAELARNIEDSFNTANPSSTSTPGKTEPINIEIATDNLHLTEKSTVEKSAVAESLIKKNTEEDNHEMMSSASEHEEMKSALNNLPVQAKEALKLEDIKIEDNVEKPHSEHFKIGKSTEFDTSVHAPVAAVQPKSADLHEGSKPVVPVVSIKKDSEAIQSKASEIMDMESDLASAQSAPVMQAVSLDAHPVDDMHLIQQKSSWKETHDKKILAKASENVPVSINEKKMEHAKSADLDTTSLMKSADLKENHLKEHMESQVQGKDAEQMIKSANHQAFINNDASNVNHHQMNQAKFATLTPEQVDLISQHMAPLKSVEVNQASLNQHHISHIKSAESEPAHSEMMSSHMSPLKTFENKQDHISLMKTAESAPHQSELMSNMAPVKSFENNHATNFNQGHISHMKTAESAPHQSEHMPSHMGPVKVFDNKQATNFKQGHISHMKTAELAPHQSDQMSHTKQGHGSLMKSADFPRHQTELVSSHMGPIKPVNSLTPEMRAAESNKQQNLNGEFNFHSQGKNWHADEMTSEAGKSFQDSEFERTAPFHSGPMEHHFDPHSHEHSHHHEHFEPHGHHHHHLQVPHEGFHDGIHGKAADVDSAVQAATLVNVNDAAGKSALEHNMMQWKQKKGAARGAYGAGGYGAGLAAGAAGGPGAVGVFPGANVGGCAIPLLLSCSPSVVPGSLTKVPSYGAHAYRADDGRFHNKRDTKKTNEKIAKVKRTPTKVVQKIPFEKKL